jgi:hypothetical protein
VCISECASMRSGERMCVCVCKHEISRENVCVCASMRSGQRECV